MAEKSCQEDITSTCRPELLFCSLPSFLDPEQKCSLSVPHSGIPHNSGISRSWIPLPSGIQRAVQKREIPLIYGIPRAEPPFFIRDSLFRKGSPEKDTSCMCRLTIIRQQMLEIQRQIATLRTTPPRLSMKQRVRIPGSEQHTRRACPRPRAGLRSRVVYPPELHRRAAL